MRAAHLKTCLECGELLPDDKVPRVYCTDCAHAFGEIDDCGDECEQTHQDVDVDEEE